MSATRSLRFRSHRLLSASRARNPIVVGPADVFFSTVFAAAAPPGDSVWCRTA